MDKLRDTYEAIGQDALNKVKFPDSATFEVSFGIVPGEQGGLGAGTWLLVSLKRQGLGVPPIVAPQPIPSLLIGTSFIEQQAVKLLNDCRQERDRLDGQQPQLPAGLAGKKL